MSTDQPDFDVLIVGAGISGIGMAAHLEMLCPDRSYAILDRRMRIGGTWDLFRYPGIRSDSDMHTLGFVFEPWRHEKAIADGVSILEYLDRIADERGIRPHIRFGHKVISADYSPETGCWQVTAETADGASSLLTARFLYLGSGYYDYDDPHDAGFDFSAYRGQVIHPQFWPQDFDCAGKRVVVIGSGATAVTLVPAMADTAASVTMLQRTPTWMFSHPAKDAIANFLRRFLPERLAYAITRFKNIRMQDWAFKTARERPERVKERLLERIGKSLGEKFDPQAFTAPYNPWDQRLCLVPDDDLFEAMKQGKARVVTGHIERFEADGVRLKSGELIEADVIVTATGLRLAIAGKIALSLAGAPIDLARHYYYKGCMFSNIPNLAVVFGYLNASWTLRADINSEFVCRVLNHMRETGTEVATPVLTANNQAAIVDDDVFDFSSGYIQRGKHIMPRNADCYPWRLNQEYMFDRKVMREGAVADGVLAFTRAGPDAAIPGELLEAAQ